jgi:hypothetical protein
MLRSGSRRLLALMLAIPAVAAEGQVCNGTTAFRYGPVRLGGLAQIGDNLLVVEAQSAIGAPSPGMFGGFGLRHTSYVGAGSKTYAMQAGYSIPIAWSGRVEVCPMVAVDIKNGPNFEIAVGMDEERMSSRAAGIGFGLGTRLISRPTFELIPFVTASMLRNIEHITFQNSTSTTRFQTQVLTGGIGFVANQQLTIRPTLAVTMRDHVGEPAYGIALSVAIPGGKLHRD